MNLDLKWSLWSRDAETFPAEALAALQRAFANKAHADADKLTVTTI